MNRISLFALAGLLLGAVACERHPASALKSHGHSAESHAPVEHAASPVHPEPAHAPAPAGAHTKDAAEQAHKNPPPDAHGDKEKAREFFPKNP